MVKIGVTFPQTEIGSDPSVIRDYAQSVEGMGYHFILAYDHVLGANADRPGGWSGPYSHRDQFHEVFVLYGYLAGLTKQIELITGVLILPQRQTALVAKQAAAIDILSGGRLRLGVGIGWNFVEYEALGTDFHNRGRRVEEQVQVLRALWTQPLVSFEGKWHHISDAGVNPLPVRRPIPIWMGGYDDRVIERIARLADGWIAFGSPEARKPKIENLWKHMQAAGRARESLGIMGGVGVREGSPADWAKTIKGWEAVGANEVTVNTMGAGFKSADDHLNALRRLKAEMG
jgi:probable F420-dependent oxidoreductase